MARSRNSCCACSPRSKMYCANAATRSKPAQAWWPRNAAGNRFELPAPGSTQGGSSAAHPAAWLEDGGLSPALQHERIVITLRQVRQREMTDSGKPAPDKRDLIAALRRFLPDDVILHATEDLRPYECDGLSAYRQTPMVAVLPRTIEQVQQILRVCHECGVPVVARGAGTGLSGGALPLGDGLLLSLARFMSILDIDPVNRTMRVQPGVRNLAISEAAAPYGLYYAPDPSSQIACTIGGNV